MSEKQNGGIYGLSQYDAMTTEELEQILRLDAQAPQEQETDTDRILCIMEVLTKRKMNNGHTGNTAQQAYDSFRRSYMPKADAGAESQEDSVTVAVKFPYWLRRLTAVAAAVVLLLVGTATAKAFGFDLWKEVVRWTQETFSFGEGGSVNVESDISYNSLQEALEEGDSSPDIVPTWIPEGFALEDIDIEVTPVRMVYIARYIHGEKILKITVRDYLGNAPVYAEQDGGLIEAYEAGGITHYLFKNNGQIQAAWIDSSCECYISGDITLEELKMMIDSIKKG